MPSVPFELWSLSCGSIARANGSHLGKWRKGGKHLEKDATTGFLPVCVLSRCASRILEGRYIHEIERWSSHVLC